MQVSTLNPNPKKSWWGCRHTRGLSRFGKEAKADTLGTLASADMDLPSRGGLEHAVQVSGSRCK